MGEQAAAVDGDVVVVVDGWEGDGLSGERVPQPGVVGDFSKDEQPSLRRAEAEVVANGIHHLCGCHNAPLGQAIYEHLCGCGTRI